MNIKYITLIGLLSTFLSLIFVSCSDDFLNKNPLDSVSSETFWESEDDVKSALAGVYSRLQQNFLGYERVYFDGLSDNAYLDPGNANQANMTIMTTGSITPGLTGALANMYSSPYRAIASCNYFLDNIDKAPLTVTQKNGYIAEARFIRALCYFDLVQLFGGVIIYDRFPKTLDEAKIAKSTQEQVYAFIESDLDFAINNLPDIKYNGRAVKGSAQGLKARVMLTQGKWSDAVTLLQQVVSSGKFALSNDYATMFLASGQSVAAVNSEIIFSTQYLAPNVHRTSPGAAGMNIEIGWWSLIQPYKDLVDDYEMRDGKTPSESPLFDANDPYKNRDPRMDMTFRVPGEVWRNAAGAAWLGSYSSSTGFLMEKYVNLAVAPFTAATATITDQDYIHLRYADILLMYAEAKNEVSGPEQSIYDAMNLVRSRKGIELPNVDQAKYNSKEKLREYIRRERRVEFALEGLRYFDLKRWRIAHIKLPTMKTPSNTPLVFEEKNYLLPFLTSELDRNPQLKQNLGY